MIDVPVDFIHQEQHILIVYSILKRTIKMKPLTDDLIDVLTLFMPLLIMLATTFIISIYKVVLFIADVRHNSLSSLMKGVPRRI